MGIAAWQLYVTRNTANDTFEASFVEEYRAILRDLPIAALLNEALPEHQVKEALPALYRYFDLCNEQVSLHKHNRIKKKTWTNWEAGIEANLKRSAFRMAYSLIKPKIASDFNDLAEEFEGVLPPVAKEPSNTFTQRIDVAGS